MALNNVMTWFMALCHHYINRAISAAIMDNLYSFANAPENVQKERNTMYAHAGFKYIGSNQISCDVCKLTVTIDEECLCQPMKLHRS